MRYRKVLLDRSFLQSLRSEHDPDHEASKRLYWQLTETYIAGKDQLFALSTTLAEMPTAFRKEAMAPVFVLRVTNAHREAAAVLAAAVPADDALTMVLLQREHINAVATTRDVWDGFDIHVLKPVASDDAERSQLSN